MEIRPLDRSTAEHHVTRIAELLASIPQCSFTPADVLATHKKGVPLLGRWEHSQYALDVDGSVCGVLLTYDRPAEPASNETFDAAPYCRPSFYLDGIAVGSRLRGQGVGTALVGAWLDSTTAGGGVPEWSLQTNASARNTPVLNFYLDLGFHVVGRKRYPNRTDTVMWRPNA